MHDRDPSPRGAARRESPRSRDVRELRPLNQPVPIQVETDPDDRPIAVQRRGWPRPRAVVSVQDRWRIDDEWWRDEIARRYFAVELEGGRHLTLYHELVGDAWYAQTYEAPRIVRKAG